MKTLVAIAVLFTAAFLSFVSAQTFTKPTITVTELPETDVTWGSCKDSTSGYLGDGKNEVPTASQLGEYTTKRLSEGYSIKMWPQPKGRVFVVATCEHAEAEWKAAHK